MKLAVDGGAFQQVIAAGILNVAVGLLNAIAQARADMSFVLVVDPRLGPVREDLLSRLSVRPEIVEAAVGPAYRTASRRLTGGDPEIRFEVDGLDVPASLSDGEIVYSGPAPSRSFRILSRADSPAATIGGGDTRRLGIAIDRIAIRAGPDIQVSSFDDPRLDVGFHAPEAAQRWTDGAAVVPLGLFPPSAAGDVEVTVGVVGGIRYRLAGGVLDQGFARVADRLERSTVGIETIRLERQLLDMGVSAYLANHFIPARFARLPGYGILYDMIPVVHPEFFFADARENFEHNVRVFQEAAHVFSISEASRRDLIRLADVAPDRVTAMLIDIDPDLGRESGAEIVEARRRHGLSGRPYVLSVGTLEPRKNHARLIEAYGAVMRGGGPSCDLAIVGKPGWGTEGLADQVAGLGLESRVRFLTDVPNRDLAALYSGALFCAYPSLYEGFGLPVLEAMACGCPVMTSDRSSMPEIAGDAALLVDPTSVGSLAGGLHRLMTNGALRDRLSSAGLEQRRRFSWASSAARVLRVLDGR